MSRIVLAIVALLCGIEPASAAAQSDLAYLEVAELQERMDRGELDSVKLVEFFLQRIAEIDQSGPSLRSVIEVNPDALAIAAELDRERVEKGARGPMHGIPVLLKANIDTGDRMDTTAGSLALAGHKAPDDAFHVARLRQAGAIILGKTNLSEWANFRSNSSSSGWSSVGGQTRNPYVLARNPCGSSSGSAVAVAAGLTVVSVGTETWGSIVCPAGINGVVGIKPTVGLVSRDGIIPISHTQDTAGPMARSVRDAAIMLTAMASHDRSDPSAGDHPGDRDYTAQIGRSGLNGRRIGVWRGYSGAEGNPAVAAIFARALEVLEDAGAEIVDPVELEFPEGAFDADYQVLLYEFKAGLNAYLASSGVDPSVGSLAKLIEFNRRNADTIMAWFGQDVFLEAEAKGPLTESEYKEALANSHMQIAEVVESVMKQLDLDAMIAPTNSPAWTTDLVNGDQWGSSTVSSSGPAAISGFPSITLPMGEIHGLPIGLSIFGLPYEEGELIDIAFAFEQRSKAWRRPEFHPSIEASVE